jgi:trans-aconitate methyltransferase
MTAPTQAKQKKFRKMVPQSIKDAIKPWLPHDVVYSEDYFAKYVDGPAMRAAPFMARSMVELFHPQSVIDVGCGTGALLMAFRDHGCCVRGFEYARAALRVCRERGLAVHKFDLERYRSTPTERYDLATSFEVAEHLPEKVADRFVALLCELAPVVACSAALPGQLGNDHVNCQPQSYWIAKFARRNYRLDEQASHSLSSEWRSNNVIGYYWENLMVFQQFDLRRCEIGDGG